MTGRGAVDLAWRSGGRVVGDPVGMVGMVGMVGVLSARAEMLAA